jgi:hypothetical protein
MRTNFDLMRRAIRLYPGNRNLQLRWIAAVRTLRTMPRGWWLDTVYNLADERKRRVRTLASRKAPQ